MSDHNTSINNVIYFHDIYEAEIINENGKKKLKVRSKNLIPCNKFSKPVTQTDVAKIYLIKNTNGNIVYIGKTRQPVSTRFRQGLNPIDGTGYYGYKWQEKEQVKIHCITIPQYSDKEIESTEAEMVFCHRVLNDKWPSFQSEIHFSNIPDCKLLAKELYDIVRE